jgi:5-methylcytosine-specific restriction endonuclease McrA
MNSDRRGRTRSKLRVILLASDSDHGAATLDRHCFKDSRRLDYRTSQSRIPFRRQQVARPFDFDKDTKNNAFFRQLNRCAHCGVSLIDQSDHAHHVVPNQSGNPANPKHAWLKGVDNCVMLCETFHTRVHQDGRFRTGATALREYFPHSHGPDRLAHNNWVKEISAAALTIYPCVR